VKGPTAFAGCVLGVLLYACTQSPLRPVGVSAVVGLHDGACGKARTAMISRRVAALTASDLGWDRLCKCDYATHMDLLRSARISDDYAGPSQRSNLLTVTFAKPILLPRHKDVDLLRPVRAMVLMAIPNSGQTMLWIGHSPEPGSVWNRRAKADGGTVFVGLQLPGDPFQLMKLGEECSLS